MVNHENDASETLFCSSGWVAQSSSRESLITREPNSSFPSFTVEEENIYLCNQKLSVCACVQVVWRSSTCRKSQTCRSASTRSSVTAWKRMIRSWSTRWTRWPSTRRTTRSPPEDLTHSSMSGTRSTRNGSASSTSQCTWGRAEWVFHVGSLNPYSWGFVELSGFVLEICTFDTCSADVCRF